jgi:DNA invertase Pin-like site-specific DNA recombinase
MRAVIYARYSAGPRQTDQSIEGQLRVCHDYCRQKGLQVVGEYCDRHISGRTDERPEFQRLIADAKQKLFEAVVVYKTDRFARNKYDSAIYKRELKCQGVQIYYAAEAIPEGPEGIILESLMEGLAEYYSAELAQKIRRGMNESALKCQSTGGAGALGYKTGPDKRFQVDESEAQAVRTIFDMYIKGESNAAICDFLNARGLRTAQGNPFNKNSVNRIIKNRKYIGEYKYHDVVVPGGVPPIVSQEVFSMAQAEMEKRKTRKRPRTPRAEYLLAGKLFCGHCKAPMVGVSGTGKSGKKWYYYYCPNNRGRKQECEKDQVPRDWLEDLVTDLTMRYILQDDVLEDLAKKVYASQELQNDPHREVEFYSKKLAENKKASQNVLKAIESGVSTQTLPARLQELEQERFVLEGELAYLKNRRPDFTEDQILFMLSQYADQRDGEDDQAYRKRIISCFVSEVYLWNDRIVIFFNISGPDGKLKSIDLDEFDQRLTRSTTSIAGRTLVAALPYGFVLLSNLIQKS